VTNYATVQQNTGSATVGVGLTATVTVPSPTTAGHKVVIVCDIQSAGTIVASGLAKDVNPQWGFGAAAQAIVFTKDTAGGESSWTITGFASSADTVLWYVFELSGLASGAVDKTASNPGSGATTQTTGTTAATTSAKELAVAVIVVITTSGTVSFDSWTNGYVQQATGSISTAGLIHSIAIAFGELTATGTTETTATYSSGVAMYGFGGVATYAESVVAAVANKFLAFF